MAGYWGTPEETASASRRDETGKLWLHTGDIATMSPDGYFGIVDCKKDVIIAAGGIKVYPREIEDVLFEHPQVTSRQGAQTPAGRRGGLNRGTVTYAAIGTGLSMSLG